MLFSYLKNRKQRVRPNNAYSEWIDILFGVPQGSILGPLLFNIFLCGLFLFFDGILVAKYADGKTPYCTGLKILDVLFNLENAAETPGLKLDHELNFNEHVTQLCKKLARN